MIRPAPPVLPPLPEKPKKQKPKVKLCTQCECPKVYEIEFRTDYAKPRDITPLNERTKYLDSDDLPGRLNGYYCHGCKTFTTIKEQTDETS